MSNMVSSKESEKKYDLILFGATGFTGGLALKYLLRQYVGKTYKASNKMFKFAICGRSEEKLKATLEAVRKEVGVDDSQQQVDILVADLVLDFPAPTSPKEEAANERKLNTLSEIVKSTRVVTSTAGPFIRYGENLVKFCAEHGVDYTDITGESPFVRTMIEKYDDVARDTGAKIVSHCAFDCSPWDLSVFTLAQEAKKKNKQISAVRTYADVKSSPSGGTIETMYEIVDEGKKKSYFNPDTKGGAGGALGFDPLLKARSSVEKSTSHTTVHLPKTIQWSEETQRYIRPFFMSQVMGNCVKRSNALLNYNDNLTFSDAEIVPRKQEGFFYGLGFYAGAAMFGLSFYLPPLRYVMRRFVLPDPGQGPSEEEMDRGHLYLTTFADVVTPSSEKKKDEEDKNGDKEKETYKCVMKFNTCPGYRDTARMLIEGSLSLLDERLEAESTNVDWKKKRIEEKQCGVVSPAAGMGGRMLDRLVATGTEVEVTVV